jgi:hypothetical protein
MQDGWDFDGFWHVIIVGEPHRFGKKHHGSVVQWFVCLHEKSAMEHSGASQKA